MTADTDRHMVTFLVDRVRVVMINATSIDFDRQQEAITTLAMQNYSHVLPRDPGKIYTPGQFADAIKESYSMDEPHNKAVVEWLEVLNDLLFEEEE